MKTLRPTEPLKRKIQRVFVWYRLWWEERQLLLHHRPLRHRLFMCHQRHTLLMPCHRHLLCRPFGVDNCVSRVDGMQVATNPLQGHPLLLPHMLYRHRMLYVHAFHPTMAFGVPPPHHPP